MRDAPMYYNHAQSQQNLPISQPMQASSKDQLSKSGRPTALVQQQMTRQIDQNSQSQLNIQKQI
jgi:hypothetical protein